MLFSESYAAGLSIDYYADDPDINFDPQSVVIAKGITLMSSTVDEVKTTFGAPSYSDDSGDRIHLSYEAGNGNYRRGSKRNSSRRIHRFVKNYLHSGKSGNEKERKV
jgi:hypothetical protein